jgi:hypothetical protein
MQNNKKTKSKTQRILCILFSIWNGLNKVNGETLTNAFSYKLTLSMHSEKYIYRRGDRS